MALRKFEFSASKQKNDVVLEKNERISPVQIELATEHASVRQLQDHVQHLHDNSQRSSVAMDTKLQRAEQELELVQAQYTGLHEEYESYKVQSPIQSVLRTD